MFAALLILVLAVTGLLGAASLRIDGLAGTLVAAYVLLVAEVTALILVLSSFRGVGRIGIALAETVLLALAFGVWWLRGRPRSRFTALGPSIHSVLRDPVLACFALVVMIALAYELVLVLVTPPNNWDSLTYHLSRAAAWLQHGGLYWIPNAPTDRLNEFQPGAELLVLYLFAATGRGALSALPQYLAQLAAMVSIFVASRRLGFEMRAAVAASLLFATFSLVGLQSTTAQNDLVSASLAIAAAALLLGRTPSQDVLAGIAVGLGLGVKLTVAIAVPVLLALAALAGWRALGRFAAAGVCGFLLLGGAGYALNVANTDQLLGHGQGRVEHTTEPSFPGSVATGYRVLYRLADLSGFSTWMLWALALFGVVFAGATLAMRRGTLNQPRERLVLVGVVTAPFLLPLFTVGTAYVLRHVADVVHLPVAGEATTSGGFSWHVNRGANEDYSAFGPLGIAVVATSGATIVVGSRRRNQLDRVVLALALPLFIVVIALGSKYNPWLSRFLLVPLALTAPLLAGWFRRRDVSIGIVVVASAALLLVHLRNQLKPIEGAAIPPWALTQVDAVNLPWIAGVAQGLEAFERRVPADECVGVLLDGENPTYLFYGPKLRRKLVYLQVPAEEAQASERGLNTILVRTDDFGDAQERMRASGWSLEALSAAFTVASRSPVSSRRPNC